MENILEICNLIRETSFAVAKYHGNGYLEKVYERALVNRLLKAGLSVKVQPQIAIHDEDETLIGKYVADLIVNDRLLIELKACKELTNPNIA